MSEQSNLALARALDGARRQSLEAARQRATGEAAKGCLDILAFAQQFDPEIKKGFELSSIEARLEWSTLHPGMIQGQVRLEKKNYSHEDTFLCSYEEAPRKALERALRVLMLDHPWFSEGFKVDDIDVDESDMSPVDRSALAFSRNVRSIGPAGEIFANMLALESAWAWERTKAQMDLEESLAKAAEAGLLPEAFGKVSAQLVEGWPGEPTLLTSLRFRSTGFGSQLRDDAVESLPELAPGGGYKAWALPSLEAGREAIWEAFCRKVAAAQEAGWTSLSVGQNMPDQAQARGAAIERELLSDTVTEAEPAASARRTLAL